MPTKKRSIPKTLDAAELGELLRSGPAPPKTLLKGETADQFFKKREVGYLQKLTTVTMRRDEKDIVYERSDPDGRGVLYYSAALARQMGFIEKFAKLNDPVLITGATGTGKEDLARFVHDISPRRKKAFVPVNCGGIHEDTLIAEMFGYIKGSHSMATEDQIGAVDKAEGGTLFLDEIGDMPLLAQVKLLRFLNDGKFQRYGDMGSDNEADVRVICATNRDLWEMIRQGTFREDLYHRIKVFSVAISPMSIKSLISKEHPERSFEEFFRRFAVDGNLVRSEGNKQDCQLPDKWTFKPPRMAPAALKVISGYPFPGNYRELINVLKHAFFKCDGETIKKDDLPDDIRSSRPATPGGDLSSLSAREFFPALNRLIYERLEREVRNRGSILAASRELGISNTRLPRLLGSARLGEAI
jgi:DNA-binding NtrC family response regulator